jgi:hypothetical protein
MIQLRQQGLMTADNDYNFVAIHRLIQDAFRKYLGHEGSQKSFDLAVRLVDRAFPKQIEGRPLHTQWEDCRNFIQHGTWLADIYNSSQSEKTPLQAPEDLGELLKSCIW